MIPGSGCVYPNTVLTIGDQVTAGSRDWKAYIGDMGTTPCIHPNSGALDDQALPFAGLEYDTRHTPFIYFHSLLDLGDCSTDDLSLAGLPGALKSHTPEYTFIAPNACADAASGPCPNGVPSGLTAEDAFLKTWVPRILASPAYRKNGMLVITFASGTPPTGTQPTGSTTPSTTPATASQPAGDKNRPFLARRSRIVGREVTTPSIRRPPAAELSDAPHPSATGTSTSGPGVLMFVGGPRPQRTPSGYFS